MRALAITGPRAQPTHVLPFQSIAKSHHAEFRILESPDAQAVTEVIESFQPQSILIFGGDGTLHRHLRTLVTANRPVLVVPVGSGNDFARANGVRTLEDATEVWKAFLRGRAHLMRNDLGLISATEETGTLPPRYFACCANIGLDSDAAQRTNAMPNWLKANAGYFLAALASLIRYQPQMIAVQTGGTNVGNISELGWFVSISNTPTYGGGLKIAPQASVTDGQLDATFLPRRAFNRLQLLRHLPKILSGAHVNLRGIKIFASSTISVQAKVPLPIYADAEYVGLTPCTVTTAPSVLSVLRF